MQSINHWNCDNCKFYNDILTEHCKSCHSHRPDWITGRYTALVEINRGIYLSYGIYGISKFVVNRKDIMNSAEIRAFAHSIQTISETQLSDTATLIEESDMQEEKWLYEKIVGEIKRRSSAERILAEKLVGRKEMTPQEELFHKFYNHEKILVKDMDTDILRDHRDSLSTIAFEAKARLVATDDETRERRAKSGNKEWLVTSLESDQTTSDAINAVKIRGARMSKMDKLRQQLLSAGIDETLANEMVKNLESKATESAAKTITFKSSKAKESIVITVQPVADSKPFNPSSLGFKCSKCGQNPCRCDGLVPVLV